MIKPKINDEMVNESTEKLRVLYKMGAIATITALAGILLDVVIGNITGGDLTALPATAAGRLAQFNEDCLLGLYNLDLLNLIVQIVMIPAIFALYIAQRQVNPAFAMLALIFFLVGTTVFIATNTALPMLDLSHKYAVAGEDQKKLLSAAGEAMLARGAHGSPGVFLAFFLPNLANLLMSFVMLDGKIFNRTTAYFGIFGSSLMLIYIVMVNFVPETGKMATAFAMPGGLLMMTWMILFSVRLLKIAKVQ